MKSKKDIVHQNIRVINGLEHLKMNVVSFQIQIVDSKTGKVKDRFPPNTTYAVFIIGHCSITSASLERLSKMGVPLLVMKPNLRPLFSHHKAAEGNYLLRRLQHTQLSTLDIAKKLIANKIQNQCQLIGSLRDKSPQIKQDWQRLKNYLRLVDHTQDETELLGLEGRAAKVFFQNYFSDYNWTIRSPRTKIDPLNAIMDIGYTILFNYIESNASLFGFDLYVGVYHKLWFNRKSLVCDLIEPFRCIIDRQIRKSLNLKEIKFSDFEKIKGKFVLKKGKNSHYTKVFFNCIIEHKLTIFIYIQTYYRCFMGRKSTPNYPTFEL